MSLTHMSAGQRVYKTETIGPLSADDSDVSLPASLIGGTLYCVEVKTSDDDAITFTIKSHLGSTMLTGTTSGATSGEYIDATRYRAINGLPTYTLAGLGSGTATIEVTVWVT